MQLHSNNSSKKENKLAPFAAHGHLLVMISNFYRFNVTWTHRKLWILTMTKNTQSGGATCSIKCKVIIRSFIHSTMYKIHKFTHWNVKHIHLWEYSVYILAWKWSFPATKRSSRLRELWKSRDHKREVKKNRKNINEKQPTHPPIWKK